MSNVSFSPAKHWEAYRLQIGMEDWGYVAPEDLQDYLVQHPPVEVAFDIETAPLPVDILQQQFDRDTVKKPEHPGVFDPSSVKFGNTTDTLKRRRKVEQAAKNHSQKIASYTARCNEAVASAFEDFVSEAPLSPITGRVVAIGYAFACAGQDSVMIDMNPDPAGEIDLLQRFWTIYNQVASGYKTTGSTTLLSFKGNTFDLRFLQKRTWLKGLARTSIFDRWGRPPVFCVDLYDIWSCGERFAKGKLDDLAAAMGVLRKLPGMDGSQFHRILPQDPARAFAYLVRDVLALLGVSQRLL